MPPVARAGAATERSGGREAGRPRKRATEVDAVIGTKVRLRRTLLGMTQKQLANAVGVTFQQVQKYERGTDRIGGSRLIAVAAALAVPVSYFFDEDPQASEAGLASLLSEPGAVTLLKAFAEIENSNQRRCIVDLVRSLAEPRPT